MGRYESAHVRLWPLLLCIALVCAFMPALAFADTQDDAEDALGLTLQAAGTSNKDDVETDEIRVVVKAGQKYVVDGSTYTVKSVAKRTVTLAKPKSATNVKVPDTVRILGKTYKVVGIGANAFKSIKSKVKTVTLGKYVTTIGTAAFMQCSKLTAVKGGAKVKYIRSKAYSGCKNMKTCTPFSSKYLSKVGTRALYGAKKFQTITVKSKLLKSANIKGSLSGSSVNTVKVNVGSKTLNKKYVKKYQTVFAKKNSGKKVTVQ